ncbi:SDR family oxidoreductase [Rhodovastum atsumiense]|uniref:SDR family oxidoreductase n=1 Tax=Rhodovastum atsumiense TaxID=504468 RepID=A0A5M6J0Z7_9PROT|nr:SDR family oxidoreductase [Rhodovastum atsumiense]KAA5613298.1 SDR family oxidoreductase [Rhodovastum atsumiense]CAH2600530.1 SDR family oxidoreductase [Rhodovastum atsumiense]
MRNVVVTGASAGVGRAVAMAFAHRGDNLALIARDPSPLEATRADVQREGAGQVLALPADVAESEAVFAAADATVAAFGGIDVWVNDAMATIFAPVATITPEEFRRATEVTYLGTVHGTLAALRHMRPRDRGSIVQVGSALSYRAIPLQAPYCGAKFAIRGFTDSLRCELAHDRSRIRLSMVQLPAVNTPQFDWARNRMPRRPRPMGQVHQPEAVAHAILRAADAGPRELWVGWPSLQSILGTLAVPGLLDRVLGRAAWDGQMTADGVAGEQPGNLFVPGPAPHRMHGRFDALARSEVPVFNPTVLRLAALTGAAMLPFLWPRRHTRRLTQVKVNRA